ncbi:CDP-glycerol glycerophosphotransferase family protein [Aeromicrobium wangtongii]|uniref:CDP-glycerol glycerophosphotransferase family protein n=1 Tax=Aeromicrobium wangtongii TaxID=2969247 RepID=UPI0020171DAE|nr:CDP-glycerol glycerophosphotransferase family protein [Aeromicrobium wangtongii]MCL3818156.1 CDP-glycerol glycerophosphotransferase family protein [Aeromicrobium wangtongii]
MPALSSNESLRERYERRKLFFIHDHRISVRFRRWAAAAVWLNAAAFVALALAVRALVDSAPGVGLWAMAVLAAAATVVALRRPAPAPHTHGLPGVPDGPCPGEHPDLGPWVIGSRIAGPLTLAVLAAGLPAWAVLIPFVVVLVLASRVAIYAVGVRRRTRRIARALADHAPRFAIAYAGYGGGPTHLTMWEEPLLSAGFPGVIFNFREQYCQYLRENTDLSSPFIQLSTDAVRDLQILVVPTLKWFFYLHNARSNYRYMAIRRVTHVWLGHGDSDKPASVFARHADYDLLVVSGTAAIERYETSGVHIPREKFVVLGRPQVHGIEAATRPIAEVERPVVLYAPTWQGKRMRVNFSSLRQGPEIVRALIDAGADVIFRPHPLSKRHPRLAQFVVYTERVLAADNDDPSTAGQHVWGTLPNETWTLNECMNRADALVSDVSSVVSDWLQSGKPYAMVSSKGIPVEEFRERFPVARGAYILMRGLDGAHEVLTDMLGEDSMQEQRRALQVRVLGGYTGRQSAEAFAAYFHDRFAGVSA